MKQIFTFLLFLFAVTFAMGQAQTGVFAKATVDPVVDGVVDAEWAKATPYNIATPVGTETPSIGAPGESTWQALWTPQGVYVLLKITDDSFFPAPSGANNWEYDKPELYFDVNDNLIDGGGPGSSAETKPGHYQFAPGFTDGKNDGTPIKDSPSGQMHAFMVTGSNYICEYFIPLGDLKNNANLMVDKTATIGFDVIFIDRDNGDAFRNQAVWSGGSYGSLDGAGHVTFEGAEADIYIDEIALTGGSITQNKGTLQMVAKLTPENATNKKLIWSVVNGTGKASIDENGLLKGLMDGTVTVTAKSTDLQGIDASVEVTISGQSITRESIWNDFNLVTNWNFDTDVSSWLFDNYGGNQIAPVSVDGAAELTSELGARRWYYQFRQTPLNAEPNIPYVLAFKSWSNENRINEVDFEDLGNGSEIYGSTTDPECNQDGRAGWLYNTTPDPTWFVFHVTFDQIKENTIQQLLWMEAQASGTVYLDSVLLIPESQYDLLATLPATKTVSMASSINRVYPSPVGESRELFVELSSVNAKVAIYNAVGQKLMEKVAIGNLAKFDVSSLRKGLYFVKLSDGSTQKFIR